MCCRSIESKAWLASSEAFGILTHCLTLSRCITIGNSWQIYVRVCITSDQLKHILTTTANLIAWIALSTESIWFTLHYLIVTLKQSEIRSGMLKKAFMKDPAAMLPQFFVINLLNGW